MSFRLVLAALALLTLARAAPAQQPTAVQQPLRVFLDCPCDFDYVRTEITYIDWVRDRADADLHILATTRQTGSGGWEYTLHYIGQKQLAAKSDTLIYVSGSTDTHEEFRRGLLHMLQLGLMRYVAARPAAQRIRISIEQPAAGRPAATPAQDRWNYWVFNTRVSGEVGGESSQTERSMNVNLAASRVTEAWKVLLRVFGDYERESFRFFDDGVGRDTTVVSNNRRYEASAVLVKSLGPHLSSGISAEVESSTFGNTRLAMRLGPAVEYDLFPYAEATRRQLTIQYAIGGRSFDYREVTIFGRTEETRAVHSLEIAYGTLQPWGHAELSAEALQYFHDRDFYRLEFRGGTSFRLVRGLSLNVFGDYSRVHDQLSLPRRDATPEEVLLRQREIQTNYEYGLDIGLSYRFGSIYNNIVNPRFGGF